MLGAKHGNIDLTDTEAGPSGLTRPAEISEARQARREALLAQMRQGLAGKGERRVEHVRQFVVNALVTQLAIAHAAGLGALFSDLRYTLQTEHSPDLPKLPLTTITFGLPSFRPPDDLILAATSFSGIPAFIELIETAAAAGLQDPLKTRLQELVR